jgi:hypothetical protein
VASGLSPANLTLTAPGRKSRRTKLLARSLLQSLMQSLLA